MAAIIVKDGASVYPIGAGVWAATTRFDGSLRRRGIIPSRAASLSNLLESRGVFGAREVRSVPFPFYQFWLEELSYPMNSIVIRSLDDSTLYRLKQLAWQRGASLDDMVRELLIEAVTEGVAAAPAPMDPPSRQHRAGGV